MSWTALNFRGRMLAVGEILAMTKQTGIRLAEVGFLLVLIAGVWLAVAQLPQLRFGKARTSVAGVALALGGALLIIAAHWGHFG